MADRDERVNHRDSTVVQIDLINYLSSPMRRPAARSKCHPIIKVNMHAEAPPKSNRGQTKPNHPRAALQEGQSAHRSASILDANTRSWMPPRPLAGTRLTDLATRSIGLGAVYVQQLASSSTNNRPNPCIERLQIKLDAGHCLMMSGACNASQEIKNEQAGTTTTTLHIRVLGDPAYISGAAALQGYSRSYSVDQQLSTRSVVSVV